MSCNQTEYGVILLPTAAVAQVKKAVRDHVNAEHDRIYKAAQEFWRSMKTPPKTMDALRERFEAWAAPKRRPASYSFYRQPEAHDPTDGVWEAFETAAWRAARANNGPSKPRAVKHEDVEPKRATNKTNVFLVDNEAGISFDGRRVTWHVDYNNHSVDRAHTHPTAVAFFKALKAVKWTRGTGGVIRSDDEYARDARLENGGSVGISMSFGPLGEKEREREMFPYGKPRGMKTFVFGSHFG